MLTARKPRRLRSPALDRVQIGVFELEAHPDRLTGEAADVCAVSPGDGPGQLVAVDLGTVGKSVALERPTGGILELYPHASRRRRRVVEEHPGTREAQRARDGGSSGIGPAQR